MNDNSSSSALPATRGTSPSTPVLNYRPAYALPPNLVSAHLCGANPVYAPINSRVRTALPIPMSSSNSSGNVLPGVLPLYADDEQGSGADSSQDSKVDDFGKAGSECLSPQGPSNVTGSPDPAECLPQQNDSQAHEPLDFNFSLTVPGENSRGQEHCSVRDVLTPDYLEDREFDFKELLRRERNRAAAHRSNIRKKQEKEARKTELARLKRREGLLRSREMDLRIRNKCLRTLVYYSGQRLPTLPADRLKEDGCFQSGILELMQTPQDEMKRE